MSLPKIVSKEKKGNESFLLNNENSGFTLTDFWIWNQSNLIENRTRGIIAEFIVKKALKIKEGIRVEWDAYDLQTESGVRVEVKSAAYIQSWEQEKYSNIQFGIAKTVSDASNPEYDGKKRRWSDYYIFCLLGEKSQNLINPLDLNQWKFFVLKTETLDREKPNQKTIGLNSLLKLNPVKCNFNQIEKVLK